jgi:peptide subunit release factor 1 (eRF1)
MTIFNIQLFGADAQWFCDLSLENKICYIENNTNQKDKIQIMDFLKIPIDLNKKEYCVDCRDKKEKISISKIAEDGNISKGNEQEVTTVVEPTTFKKPRKHRNNK